jgi:hypothetical protein
LLLKFPNEVLPAPQDVTVTLESQKLDARNPRHRFWASIPMKSDSWSIIPRACVAVQPTRVSNWSSSRSNGSYSFSPGFTL